MRSRVRFGGEDDRQVLTGMQGYGPSAAADSNSTGSERRNIRLPQTTDTPSVQQCVGFRIEDALNFSRDPMFNQTKSGDRAPVFDILRRGINKTVPPQWDLYTNPISIPGVPVEYWGESNMADASPRTDTSTDDTDDRNQRVRGGQLAVHAASDSSDRSKEKTVNQKNLRRLAQNLEAARKSILRKKAYVQQLEISRLKLTQLEQEQQRARQQGIFISSSEDQSHQNGGNGALAFDVEYARWLEEHSRRINELRSAVNHHVGMWKTPAERCFMWTGGLHSSELLKAEDTLSQGMGALQQSLAETLANDTTRSSESTSGNVTNYMGKMAMAMGKLGTLERFLKQAHSLQLQTMQQMYRILMTRQSAHTLLVVYGYYSRLRALSSLWLARPRE